MFARKKTLKPDADNTSSGPAAPPDAKLPLSDPSDAELDRWLQADATTRKHFYGKFTWFHDRVCNRQTAETKLKAATQEIEARPTAVVKRKKEDKSKENPAPKNDVLFLVRSSIICPDDYILSYIAPSLQCYHYYITLDPHGLYSLEHTGGESRAGGSALFRGLNELVDTLTKPNTYIPHTLGRACLGGGAPPSLAISQGYRNILHRALAEGNGKLALRIMASKLRPPLDDRDSKGNTALHLACAARLHEVVHALLAASVSVCAVDQNRCTALHLAVRSDSARTVQALVAQGGADAQRRHQDTGDDALHMAAAHGHIECVRALLAHDVTAHVRNYAGRTPYELARDAGHTSCAQAIDNYKIPPARTQRSVWFHGPISRQDAAAVLDRHGCLDGLFLVRASSKEPDRYVLDLCYRQTKRHYVIDSYVQRSVYFIAEGPLLPTLELLVEYYTRRSDGLVCKLRYAASSDGFVSSMAPPSALPSGGSVVEPLPLRDRPPVASEPLVLDRASVVVEQELGQGEYGSVMRGVWTAPTGEKVSVAIKTLNVEHMATGKEGFLREAQVMVRLDHPCIVRLIGISQGEPLMLVQELLAMGSLLDFLLDYPEKVAVERDLHVWAGQIAYGMSYLERQQLVHRDLAARNILLASKSRVKICDFGLSRAVGVNDYYRATHGGKWPVKWYAPEAMNYGTFSSASDVWSYGVTLWEMYALGDQPYGDLNGTQVLQLLERGVRLERPDLCPPTTHALMRRCWEYKSADRPTFGDIHKEFQRNQNYENVSATSDA